MHVMPGHYRNPADDPGIVDQPASIGMPIVVGVSLGIFTYLVLLITGIEMVQDVARPNGQLNGGFWGNSWMWVAPLIALGVTAVSIGLGVVLNRWLPNRHPGEEVRVP